ncbi:MAG: GNAT family N-acetyltransferase [Gemmatimonadetes bacterium]|nr:GNAT family N-acetyltransferase [Gemmatimonadota bacterium]MBI3567965.1 GNAT family N-acetyltransferase [Gemmatimonadota bacterium]
MPTLRTATADDIPALNALIERSARALSVGFYTPVEIDAAVRYVFGVDSRLVADGTYFVVEDDGAIVGCGGWSWRRTLYGGDQRPMDARDAADPAVEPAKVRAFFVAPERARRGIGRQLLTACFDAARAAGFRRVELMATLPGVPLYAAAGFMEIARVVDTLPDGTPLPFVRMGRSLES